MPPLILDIKRLKARRTPIQLRSDWIAHTFGQLSTLPELPSALAIQTAAVELPGNLVATWRNCIAAELLLRHNTGKPVPLEWVDTFGDASPFFDQSNLEDLLRTPLACCLFPLASEKSKPGTGVAWVQKDHSPILVTDVERQDWNGDSWQLAAALARQVIASGSHKTIEKLATDWIVTGTCEGNRIGPVELGNKLDLDTRRHWILPAALTPLENTPRGQIFRAATVQSAFNIVTGQGYQKLERQKIPQPVDVLHTFVSKARTPVLQLALAVRPGKIVLWYSAEFEQTRLDLEKGLLPAFLPPGTCNIASMPIGSKDLAAIEQAIRPVVQADLDRRIVFNFTSGNMIQRLAFASIASAYPDILLVYRDSNNPSASTFTTLSYQTYPPSTCPGAEAVLDATQVNIPRLVEFDDGKTPIQELILQLLPEKSRNPCFSKDMTNDE